MPPHVLSALPEEVRHLRLALSAVCARYSIIDLSGSFSRAVALFVSPESTTRLPVSRSVSSALQARSPTVSYCFCENWFTTLCGVLVHGYVAYVGPHKTSQVINLCAVVLVCGFSWQILVQPPAFFASLANTRMSAARRAGNIAKHIVKDFAVFTPPSV